MNSMNIDNRIFSMGDIPYDILQGYGISQEMIDDLPEDVLNDLLSGRRTPPMPVTRKLKSGKEFKGKASIFLVRTEERVNVMFVFRWEGDALDGYDNDVQNELRGGHVVVLKNDELMKYAQLDNTTNRVMKADGNVINHNIDTFSRIMGLSEDERKDMLNKPFVTFSKDYGDKGTATMTSGIDLHAPNGILSVIGDAEKWELAKTDTNLSHYNWGMYGCWETGDDGTFNKYIPEEEYTEEMYQKMHEEADSARQNINRQQHL